MAPEAHRTWARHLRDHALGNPTEPPAVARFRADDDDSRYLDIFFSTGADGGVLAATIGLMDIDVGQAGRPIFTEILMDSRVARETIGNTLCRVGLFVSKDGWRPAPGIVFEDMLLAYEPGLAVKHVLFVPPFEWPDGQMSSVDVGDRTIHPLLAVPITDAERDFVYEHDGEALEELWEASSVDVLDWDRGSSV